MNASKRIRTTLYGDQRLSSAELEVLHTPAMQRLYGLRQLGLTDRVFIDASHARIHHVVGVLQQVEKLVTAISANLERASRTLRIGAANSEHKTFTSERLASFVKERKPVVRFIGLLHDLTHAPFGHTVEDEIQLVESKHDEPARQAEAFFRLVCQLVVWLSIEADGPNAGLPPSLRPFTSQAIGQEMPDPAEVGHVARMLLVDPNPARFGICWRLSLAGVAEMFAHLACAMTALLHLEALHDANPKPSDIPNETEYPFQEAIRHALEDTKFERLMRTFDFQPRRDAFMLDIVGNTVCADLLDYAKRDSVFCGLRLDYDPDRIAENFTLVSHDAAAYELNHPSPSPSESGESEDGRGTTPFAGWCLRTAISLFSHKYRTDVPSELMNLLNVRYYLYERAIYHPTKCAAGSMLGTALQLLGWRKTAAGRKPTLPAHLRFVGDDVFLHDISSALNYIASWVASLPPESAIDEAKIRKLSTVDSVHSGLVPALLQLRVGQNVGEARAELAAARIMLDRLLSRRYFRPVFRALPSSTETTLHAGAEALADVLRRPDERYDVERRIEVESGLPMGTITIHCPRRKTAQKIANVLLTKPGENNVDEVCKLKDIASLDLKIFGEHEKAVKAVEEMYRSMWRLNVYVAPEHLHKFEAIGTAAGMVIFKTIDIHGHFAEQKIPWQNDPNLRFELTEKAAPQSDTTQKAAVAPSPLAAAIGAVGDALIQSGQLKNLPPEAELQAGIPAETRARVERALIAAFANDNIAPTDPELRVAQLMGVFRTYVKRVGREDAATFKELYSPVLALLPQDKFEGIVSELGAAILETQNLEQGAAAVNKGYKFRMLLEVLDGILKRHGGPPQPQKGSLFEESK